MQDVNNRGNWVLDIWEFSVLSLQLFCKSKVILFLKLFVDVDHFLKVFIEFVTILLLLFKFCFFGQEACGVLAP